MIRNSVGLAAMIVAGVFSSTAMSQQIVAHRGASHEAPENTIAAFQLAWEEGADAVEGDFYFTRDQQIVCIHDKDTERTAGTKKLVAECTLEELRTLEYGSWKDPRFRGESIPTFAEVWQCIPADKVFVIELKTGPKIVPLLVEQLKQLNADARRLLVISFQEDTIAACKKLMPEVKAHWLTSYKRNRFSGAVTPTVDQVIQTLKRCNADGLGSKGDREVVNEEFVARLRNEGFDEFHVWTIDDPSLARYFQGLGAMAITTNRPAFIRSEILSATPR